MRVLRTLAAAVVTAALLAIPALVTAQSDDPLAAGDEAVPRALGADGRAPLEGMTWRLRGYRWNGVARTPGPEVAARMTLAGGKLDASGGCTPIKGSYGAVGYAIDFELKRLQENDCGEQTTLVQLGMVDGLRKATRFETTTTAEGRESLALFGSGDAPLLHFEPDQVGALDANDWALVAYTRAGERTVADSEQPARLSFRTRRADAAQRTSSGRLNASSGCNGIVGDFYQHADVLSFGPLASTEAPCSPAVTAQEEAVTAVLDSTSLRLALGPDRLVLTAVEGDALDFTSTRPLENTTWMLVRLGSDERPSEPVTLRLADGAASGQGPCGPFDATYATGGRFITFDDVAVAGDDSCELFPLERELRAALRSAVVLDRDQPQLRLRDAQGRIIARFKAPSGP